MMQWGPVSAEREAVRAALSKLMLARRDSPALRRGDLQIVESSPDHLVFTRAAPGSHAVAAFNRSDAPRVVTLGAAAGAVYTDAVSGTSINAAGGTLSLTVPARSARLLTAAP